MREIYDRNRVPIRVGDTLKIFHYVGARRKKVYMYKWVRGETCTPSDVQLFIVSHLNCACDTFHMLKDDTIHDEVEIVQGYGIDGKVFSKRKQRI